MHNFFISYGEICGSSLFTWKNDESQIFSLYFFIAIQEYQERTIGFENIGEYKIKK